MNIHLSSILAFNTVGRGDGEVKLLIAREDRFGLAANFGSWRCPAIII